MVTVSLSPGEQWLRTSEKHPPSPISKARYIAGREKEDREKGREGGRDEEGRALQGDSQNL